MSNKLEMVKLYNMIEWLQSIKVTYICICVYNIGT